MIARIKQWIARLRAPKLERGTDGRFIARRVSVALKMAEAMQRDDLIARLNRG